ncbi:GNAT family N-acetyltransferase [Microbacterium sp.]|uniref:GNAT family N-acetyltransferase n=1 Tax=Microbacterium sp. TaxID=51671 RepID=UPI0035B391A0
MSADAASLDIRLIPVDPLRDATMLQRWLAHPHSAFWGMPDLTPGEIRSYLAGVVADPAQDGWLGLVDGVPTFYVETYDPAQVLLTGIHPSRPGDLGMHILIAPPAGPPRHGLTDAVFAAVMAWCFDARSAERVVVEPDVRNSAIRLKNRRAGFVELSEVSLVDGSHVKQAMLSVCTRRGFAASELSSRAPLVAQERSLP